MLIVNDRSAFVATPINHSKCPTLDSFVRGMQGHRGCVGYMYMGCYTDGGLTSIDEFNYIFSINYSAFA